MPQIIKLYRAGAVFVFIFIVLRPAQSLANSVYFHHFFRSETTGSPIYLSGNLPVDWLDALKMPDFQSQRKQLTHNEWFLVVKHPRDQKASFKPAGVKLYSRGLLPDWIACHLSWPSDLRLQTNPTEPYELHTLSGPIIPGCSQFRSDTDKAIAFVPVDDSEPGIYPNGLWLIEIPPLKQVDKEHTRDNFGILEIPNPADLKDLLPGAYGSGSGFGFDFKPGGGGWSNLMDINIMVSLLPTAREKRGESRPVLVLGRQEGVSIEVVDARGHQWHRFYTMDEASELLEGIEDGEGLLPRLRGNHWVVKAGKVEDLSSLCRESIRRIVRQAGPGAWFQEDLGEIYGSSGNVAEFVVPGAISFNNDKNQKSSDYSGQQAGNKQGSSAQASGTSNTGTASASKVSGGGATGGSGDGQDNEEKPGKKIKSQCEASAVKEIEIQEGSATSSRDRTPSYQPCKASCFEVRKTIPEESASLIIQQTIQDLEWDIIEATADTIHLDISKSLTRKQPTKNNVSSLMAIRDQRINMAMVDRRIKKAHSISPGKLFEFIAETLLCPLWKELENKNYFLEIEGSIESLHLTWYTSPFVGQHIRSGDMPENLEERLITLDLTGVAPEDTDSALLAVEDGAAYSSPAKKALLMTMNMCTCQALILSHPVHRSALLLHFTGNMVSRKNVKHVIDLFTGLVGTTENIEARVVGGYTGQLEGFHKSFLPALNHHGINIVETFVGNPAGRPMDIIFDPHKNELFRLKISMETKKKLREHHSPIRAKCIRGQHPFSLYTSDNPEHLLQLHLKAK